MTVLGAYVGAHFALSLATIWVVLPAWISAAAVVVGWIAFLLTRRQRRRRAEREEQLTADVAEMGDAIGELTTMVTSLAEEMRGRSPRPQLRFKVQAGPTPSVVVRVPAIPTVDVEAIVAAEREAVPRRPVGAHDDNNVVDPSRFGATSRADDCDERTGHG